MNQPAMQYIKKSVTALLVLLFARSEAQFPTWQQQEFGKSFHNIDDDNLILWLSSSTQITKQNKITQETEVIYVRSHFSTSREIQNLSISDEGEGVILLKQPDNCELTEDNSSVLLFSNDGFINWLVLESPNEENFISAFISDGGEIICVTNGADQFTFNIYKLQGNQWTSINSHQSETGSFVFNEFFGIIYYRMGDSIFRINEEGSSLEYFVEGYFGDFVVSSEGELWYVQNGLKKQQNGVIESINSTNSSLPSNNISNLVIDENDFVWASFLGSSLLYRTNGFVSTIFQEIEVTGRIIFHIGTNELIYALDKGTDRVYSFSSAWNTIPVESDEFKVLNFYYPADMCRASAGGHWVTGYINTSLNTVEPIVCFFNQEEKQVYDAEVFGLTGQQSNSKIAIDEDFYGDMWLGSENGLWKFSSQNWEHYSSENSSLPCNYVLDIDFDVTGNLWVLTEEGLFKRQGEDYIYIGLPSGNFENAKLVVLNNGTAWVLWSYDSLWYFDGVVFQEVTNVDTPLEGTIKAIGGRDNQIVFVTKTFEEGVDWLNVYKNNNFNWSVYSPLQVYNLLPPCNQLSYLSVGIDEANIYLAGLHSDFIIDGGGVFRFDDFGVELLSALDEGMAYNSAALIESGMNGVSLLHLGALNNQRRTAVSFKNIDNSTGSSDISSKGQLEVILSPNPNPSTLTILCESYGLDIAISCYDSMGRIVFQSNSFLVKGENHIPLSDLTNGNYFILIHSDRETITRKVLYSK
jgi:hypothetical protein